MAFKMKPFSGFGNSPMKQNKFIRTPDDFDHEAAKKRAKHEFKKPTGPRAKVKKKTIDFENPKDRDKVYNKTEIKRP